MEAAENGHMPVALELLNKGAAMDLQNNVS